MVFTAEEENVIRRVVKMIQQKGTRAPAEGALRSGRVDVAAEAFRRAGFPAADAQDGSATEQQVQEWVLLAVSRMGQKWESFLLVAHYAGLDGPVRRLLSA